MRFFFLLVLLAGVGAGIVYPWAIINFSGREIGTWRVYERGRGFREVTAPLTSADEPVRVLVDLTSIHQLDLSAQHALLTVTASTDHRTVLAETVSFSESTAKETSPQLPERTYRDEAGVIAEIEDGDYTFTVGPGDADGIVTKSVDLVLRRGAGNYDRRAQPVGISLLVIGVVGLVLSLRRGRTRPPQNPNSQPPPPRWGRGGARR